MIRMNQLKLPITHSRDDLEKKIAKALKTDPAEIDWTVVRQSLDARHKNNKQFVYTIDVKTAEESRILRKVANNNIMLTTEQAYRFPSGGTMPLRSRPVIIGTGPAGLFCGWYLARAGYAPILLERGEPADVRAGKVRDFWKNGNLDPDSNVQFGEGGAGTFSDGKLNTLVKDPFGRNREVLLRFTEAGAPKEILYQNKPHLGTDQLISIVQELRRQIIAMGGEVRFSSKVTDLCPEEDFITVTVNGGQERIQTQVCVLAVGHSARDTFFMLNDRKIPMQPKAFAVGVRMEHPQELINMALYGEPENPILGPAAYKVTHTCENGRGVYSFCMCPGGYVVNASSEEGHLAVNGMSYHDRSSSNANSAVIVTVSPEDFPESGPLGGVRFQRNLEKAAWDACCGKIPVQLWKDFRDGRESRAAGSMSPCICGSYAYGNVRRILPPVIGDSIEEGVLAFDRKIRGFAMEDALISGVESRTSSPVRILRDPQTLTSMPGLYPCGEGAGYAGGITSAAMDGIKTAEAIARQYSPFRCEG